jgi:predicted DNA binding CopG/RHH family protein
LKSQIYPYDDIPLKRFHEWLNELEKLKRIISFTASNEQYYFIPGFAKHQKVDHPSKQRNPEPPPEILANDSRDFLDETETETETETDNKQKQKPDKLRFLEFVFLTDEEYKKLVDRFGKQLADEKIQALNDGIGSKGYKYQSHYHTILSWDRKNQKDKPQRTDTDFDYINKAFEGKA